MRILVLVGGDSNEREVSLDSGLAVCGALKRLGHDVRALDPATGRSLTAGEGKFLPRGDTVETDESPLVSLPTGALISSLASEHAPTDVVFIALHGGSGENGSIQNLLDLANVKYTGSGRTASVVAMDKALTKRLMASVGVSTPDWALYRLDETTTEEALADLIADRFSPPIIIKPNDGGSTIGLTRVDDRRSIPGAVKTAAGHSRDILVEQYIPGRELTVSVFDGRACPVVEIKPASGLYDYDAKYTKGNSEYIVPAELDDKPAVEIQQAAVRIYSAIGCAGLARVDFILDEQGSFQCLEVNTLPGMTELSLAPMALASEGIDFDSLVRMILESALKR